MTKAAVPYDMPGRYWRMLRSRWVQLAPSDRITVLLLAALVIIALFTFRDYAISNDEGLQHRYGEMIVSYYASGFSDLRLFQFDNLYLYGGLFDIIAVLLAHLLPFEPYAIRHVLCALIGIGGIAATAATARLIAGPRAGLLAALALTVCGVWYGGMFNHTKDVPLGAAMMAATYFLLRAGRDLPHPRWFDVLAFGLALGAALGGRAMGLLFIGYTGLVGILRLPRLSGGRLVEDIRFVLAGSARLLPAFVLAYVIMIASWPWAALAPLNPLRAIFAFAHFHYEIHTVLAGKVYTMSTVPRWYVPLYLLIKIPIVVWLGALLSVAFAARPALFLPWARSEIPGPKPGTATQRREIALLAFMVVFPPLCEVIGHGPAFTGMRHFLFVLPPLAALAGIGFHALLGALEGRARRLAHAASAALAAALAWNAGLLVALHPDQYLYYNALVGGLQGASQRYATDYWVNIMPEAVGDLERFLDRTQGPLRGMPSRRYTVAVCGERLPFEKVADPRLKWTDDWDRADFFIAPTHMHCDRVVPGRTIATIERIGVPIGVVKDRRTLPSPGLARGRRHTPPPRRGS